MSEIAENHKITDVGAGLVKAIMNTNPITGFVQTIYDEYAGRQWQQRREKWEEILEEKLQKLKDSVNFNKINSISNFAQILANVTQGAMVDVEEDKINLYADLLISIIKKENVFNTKIHIFLNILRDYTLLHMQFLKLLSEYSEKHPNTINQFYILDYIKSNAPKEMAEIWTIITMDLYQKKLITISKITDTSSGLNEETLYPQQLTNLGKEFLSFISL